MRGSRSARIALVAALGAALPAAGCGDDDGSGGGELLLVARTPAPDDDNVWLRDPIVLEFSRALDPASVSDASIQLDDGGPVAHEPELSEDGTTVALRIQQGILMPATITVTVTDALRAEDGTAFAGESWSFALPVWQRPVSAGAIREGSRPGLALDPDGAPVVAWIDGGGELAVRRLEGAAWSDMVFDPTTADQVRLVGDGASLLLAHDGGGGVTVARWAGFEIRPLDPLPAAAVDDAPVFDLAIDVEGRAVVAVQSADGIEVLRWGGEAWLDLGRLAAAGAASELALAVDQTSPVVALVDPGGALRVFRQTTVTWLELAGGVDLTAAERPDLVAAGGTIALSWQRDERAEGGSRHALAARWDGERWLPDPGAADLDIQSDAAGTALAVAADGGRRVMAWFEGDRQSRKVYAATISPDGESWTFLDSALNADPAVDAGEPALAIDGFGDPVVAFAEGGEVMLARWNGSYRRRRAIPPRLPAGDCAIPEAAPPATLSATGCYADVAGHEVAPQLVPFEINSPLWSDGALKRRFLLVPDGAAIGFHPTASFAMPVGSLLVKEFWLEARAGDPTSRLPVETRFLVKRCDEGDCLEPWQGYSYRWRADGSEADLISPGSTDQRTGWTITDRAGQEIEHTHIYPSRLNCVRCHSAAAGRVLGLQGQQLDRPGSYGGVIADQLEAMGEMGLFATEVTSQEVLRLPSSLDPGFGHQERARAYLHANCASCHQPGAERPTIDLRYQAPLAADNICDRLTPGDAEASAIYTRDATRGAGQMPPLASDLPDGYQLLTTAAWIDGMSSCP